MTYLFLLFSLIASPIHLLADDDSGTLGPQPEDHSLRERCRSAVAGRFIELYDNSKQQKEYVSLLRTKQKRLKAGISDEEKKLKEKEKNSGRYDIDTQRDVQAIKNKIDNLKTMVRENDELMNVSIQKAELWSNEYEALKKKIVKLFKIEILQQDVEGKYPFALSYIERCPRYRQDCPLSKQSAYDLSRIFKEKDTPEVCKQYAALMR